MSLVRVVQSQAEYDQLMTQAGAKLVVVDFTAKWCGPCKQIAPVYQQMSTKYPNVLFLKVDVDDLRTIAQQAGIRAMPTFQFYKSKSKIAEFTGAQPAKLEALLKEHSGGEGGDASSSSSSSSSVATIPGGYRDLSEHIERKQVNCLNEDSKQTSRNLVEGRSSLASDCDEQLLLEIPFNQSVKIHSFSIQAKDLPNAPKSIKLYVNRTKLGFDEVGGIPSQQDLTLTEKDFEKDAIIPLKFVKFQNVVNLQIFIENNQGGEEITKIDSLRFYGTAEASSNMKDFKRVTGNEGESE